MDSKSSLPPSARGVPAGGRRSSRDSAGAVGSAGSRSCRFGSRARVAPPRLSARLEAKRPDLRVERSKADAQIAGGLSLRAGPAQAIRDQHSLDIRQRRVSRHRELVSVGRLSREPWKGSRIRAKGSARRSLASAARVGEKLVLDPSEGFSPAASTQVARPRNQQAESCRRLSSRPRFRPRSSARERCPASRAP